MLKRSLYEAAMGRGDSERIANLRNAIALGEKLFGLLDMGLQFGIAYNFRLF
ncbi:MAG: hypothetical protein PUP92_40480 [Rhizonema sp. PD38]|nr:hypothetical protein [Rhizonema sp. PD38]